jgi:allantoinase
VQFVLNYEEGGENSVLHGDAGSEQFLSEMFNPRGLPGRHLSMEGIYEYGSRVGVWRILREFERRGLPLTVFGVGMALERCPEVTAAFVELGHEIACHGWRWIHYQNTDEATEREHMRRGMADHRTPDRRCAASSCRWAGTPAATAPTRAAWWPTTAACLRQRLLRRRPALLAAGEEVRRQPGAAPGGALHAGLQRHALCAAAGLQPRRRVLQYLRDAFDVHYAEGRTAEDDEHRHALPAAGPPGRMKALQRFLDHVQSHDRVWVTRRIDIARHWKRHAPLRRAHRLHLGVSMLTLDQTQRRHAGRVHALLDGTYEHSPWIAERAWAQRPFASLAALKHALVQVVRATGPRGAARADPRPPRAGRQGRWSARR